jgi:two-component system, OmpR family, response regulator CpxR
MAIISIFSGSFCHGETVADDIAARLGYRRIGQEVLTQASSTYNLPENKLLNAMTGGGPSLFGISKQDREKYISYLRYTIAQHIQEDNVVVHGLVSRLIPRSLTHVLQVCVIANLEYRIEQAMEQTKGSRKQAHDLVLRQDKKYTQWTEYLFGRAPYETMDFDLVLPMHELTETEASGQIFLGAGDEALRSTDKTSQAAKDFELSAQIHTMLAQKGHVVTVSAENGKISIAINKYVRRLEDLQKQLVGMVEPIPGVKSVTTVPGLGFIPPGLVEIPGLPSRVLLVDDEKEFVHSLSERLHTRNFDSSIVYDGEQALASIAENPPEVMVLDLKMPGIDGLEVLRRVKRDNPDVEVIILTGHGSDREKQVADELGAFSYLTKPVNINVLTTALKAAHDKVKLSKAQNRTDE